MNQKQLNDLSAKITDDLFRLGSEPGEQQCRRIEFKCGLYPKETGSGGLCREAFQWWLCEALAKHTQKGA